MQCSAARPVRVGQRGGAAVVQQHQVERAAGRRRASPRSTWRCRGSSARRWTSAAAAAGRRRGRPRSAMTFSMPMTVIRVSGRVRHIRPLPSDSTTHSVPVSATAKLAPLIPTLRGQELAPQVQPGRLGQRGRVVGQAGSTSAISRRKISRISARLRWMAGTRMCDGQSSAELDDELGQVGLVGGDARVGERLVQADLVGGQRLDLDHLAGAGRPDQAGHDGVGLGGVPGPVHGAAAGGDLRLELLQVAVQVGHGRAS